MSNNFSRNHNSVNQNTNTVQNMIKKELEKGRLAGPFSKPPFKNFVVSPLGLVQKKQKNSFRLIHDLSFPKLNSVNHFIDKSDTTVKYETLDHVISLVKKFGKNCLIAKTDIEEAFRLVPINPSDYHLLGFTFMEKFYYDKCLPMGVSTACRIFERFSRALQWVMQSKFNTRGISHILDDFIFVGPPNSPECRKNLETFLKVCKEINVPIKHEKTVLPTTVISVHGVEIDTHKMEARLPADKLTALREMLKAFSKRKKCTLTELQSLVGHLNFACRVIVPGRVFKRRISRLMVGVNSPFHHIRLNRSFREDVSLWLRFLQNYNGRSVFLDEVWLSSKKLEFWSDASGQGAAAIFGNKWCHMLWPDWFATNNIAILELCPIVVGIELWGHLLTNRKVIFLVDNESVVEILNAQSSKDSKLLNLTRRFVLLCLRFNIVFRAKHVPGIENKVADSLSRSQFQVARKLQPALAPTPSYINQHQLPWNWNI